MDSFVRRLLSFVPGRTIGKRSGFTLMELLIVVTIIILLVLLVLINLRTQILRGRDSRRKADLNKVQKAFEEYFNDRENYPYAEILDSCGSDNLAPYVNRVPCDPKTQLPYLYIPSESATPGYALCAALEDLHDPDIARVGCDPTGCGFLPGYNYCVSAGIDNVATGFYPGSGIQWTPTSTPTPYYGGDYACTPAGNCNQYDDPALHGCPIAFAETDCQGACINPAYRCLD